MEKIILYLPSAIEQTERWLRQMVLQVIPEDRLVVFHEAHQLKEAISLRGDGKPIVLTYVSTFEDVIELATLTDWLDSLYLIIFSESSDPDFIARCRSLYPRFICKNEQDMNVAVAVIEKRMAGVASLTKRA